MEETTRTTTEPDGEQKRLAAALPGYEIGAALGRGAFAVVYAGRHRRLEREVAIKRLSPDLLREEDARSRFAAEARLLASLDHPHIVRIYDYVEEDDVCAFVMERMRGGTLADRMAVGRLSRPRACAVALAGLHGLEHAHRQGVLHRDVKPENLLFGDGELVKVADFGIAKVVGAQGARLTATAAAIGTPAYMAPEQVTRSAGRLSSATDVWAVGAVLYELLAGERPFVAGGDLGEVLVQRVVGEARPLLDVAPDVPEDLAAVVMRALQRNPDDRYPTPGAFAAALEPAAERAAGTGGLAATGIPIHRTPPLRDDARAPTLVESSEVELLTEVPTVAPATTWARGRRVAVLAALIAGLAAVAAVAAVLAGGGGDEARALPPPPAGWPKTLSLGIVDQVDGPAGVARRLGRGGTTHQVYFGDAAAKQDWSHDRNQPRPAQFVRSAHRAGLYPYLVYYQLRALGQPANSDPGAPELRQTLADPRLMGIYWRNVRRFLKEVGSTGLPAAISIDAAFWSYLEQHLTNRGERPDTVRARVGVSGLPELRGIPDTLVGVARGWSALRDAHARRVALGYEFNEWGAADIDISRDSPPVSTVVASARQSGEFFTRVAANDLDFAALVVNGEAEEGQRPTPKWNYSATEKEALVAFIREFVRVAGIPMVLEGVPLGNTVTKAITDRDYHWRDTWVQWMLGNDSFDGLRKLHDAGVIGVMFGVGFAESETCPCDAAKDGITNDGKYPQPSTSADDDGGYFADRVAALRKAGGLPLR